MAIIPYLSALVNLTVEILFLEKTAAALMFF